MKLSDTDLMCFERAVKLAQAAELLGNLPIGSVVAFNGEIIAEGKNAIWEPQFDPCRHAEMEALRAVPAGLWPHARQMTLYTTLEPCVMCVGGILQHFIGRVLFGRFDPFGGGGILIGRLPPYFEDQMALTEWIGPAYPEECDKLYDRVMELVEAHRDSEP